jgi:hypothetical protein
LTIFFVNSIQLTNCDSSWSQYKKGRIENYGNQKGSKETSEEGREEEKEVTFLLINLRGRESVPFAFCHP